MVKEVFIGRNLKGITDREDFCLGSWPEPDVGTLSSRDLDRFLRCKKAVVLYLKGAASDSVYTATGIHARFLNRMIRERCMHPLPNGRIYGWQALVPSVRIGSYRRQIKGHADANGRCRPLRNWQARF